MFISASKKLSESGLGRFVEHVENVNILNARSAIRVLHWQPCENLVFNDSYGFCPTNNDLEEEALQVVHRASGLSSDNGESSLLLTPEYSFPYSVLKQIIYNQELWPRRNQLWCLAMQGCPLYEFENFIKSDYSGNNVYILKPKITERKSYVNAIFYLLIGESPERTELLLMPQLKFQHAADHDSEYEDAHMSVGNEILLLTNPKELTCFTSLICADLLNTELTILFSDDISEKTGIQNLPKHQFTIFNPQLNIKPFHNNYTVNISSALEFMHKATYRFIALNWSVDTKICTHPIRHGVSALLSVVDNLTQLTKNRSTRHGVIIRNPQKKFLMVCYPPLKHLLMYTIPSNSEFGQARAIGPSPQFSPLAVFTYQGKEWKKEESLCQIDWSWVNGVFSLTNTDHGDANNCDANSCPSNDVKMFFQTFFAKGYGGDEYQIKEPFLLFQNNIALENRERLERVASCIASKHLPQSLQSIAKDCQWTFEKANRNLKIAIDENQLFVRLLHSDTYHSAVCDYGIALKKEMDDSQTNPLVYVYYPTATGYEVYFKYSTDIYSVEPTPATIL